MPKPFEDKSPYELCVTLRGLCIVLDRYAFEGPARPDLKESKTEYEEGLLCLSETLNLLAETLCEAMSLEEFEAEKRAAA